MNFLVFKMNFYFFLFHNLYDYFLQSPFSFSSMLMVVFFHIYSSPILFVILYKLMD